MHIHKAQGKVSKIRLKLIELSKAINSKALVDNSDERLLHAEKLDRMLDETIKELSVLSEVTSSAPIDTAMKDSSVTKNVEKSEKFSLKDDKRTKAPAYGILANDLLLTEKEISMKRGSPAHSTTDVSSLSALQSELCSFFAEMKIQTDRLLEEAENHHEVLLNYGNRGGSCSSDLSSIISGFA